MKIALSFLVFLLPWHALMVTFFKCKMWIDTNILRFWKEIMVVGLLVIVFFQAYKKAHYSLKNLYKNNSLLSLTTSFIVCSALYMYLPFFELKAASVLGFRYDVFFLLTMLIGLYSIEAQKHLSTILKSLFISTGLIVAIFLPWFLFGDISGFVSLFGYSSEVSSYTANACLSFAQNVEGGHARFQATFWGPIRFSVFLTVVFSIFSGYILSLPKLSQKKKYILLASTGFFIILSIFFSFSKTSLLGLMFAGAMFLWLTARYVYKLEITKKMLIWTGIILFSPFVLIALINWHLFLHLWAVLNRLDNLKMSLEMFFYSPIGYGLGIAGPASQIGNSIESAGNWTIATNTVTTVHRFLPENWYVQILLEQGIVGFTLFVSLLILIGIRLIHRIKKHRDYLSIGVATAFFSLCFMANFTHAFEEAATSYTLFLIIGILLAEGMHEAIHASEKRQKKIGA